MAVTKSCRFLLIALVLSIVLTQETDARRTILKGRRVITRSYLYKSPIAAWAMILLVGLGEIIVGVIIYFVMKKIVIDPPITGTYTPANTEEV